jgi:hypothetical protein
MLSDLELNVIAGFFPRPHQCLLPVIQRRINYGAQDIFSALTSLAERKIVEVVWLGGATGYSLMLDRDEAESGYRFYVKLRMAELKRRYGNAAASLESWADGTECDIVLAHGSYAKGTTARGDAAGAVAIIDLKGMMSWSNPAESKKQNETEQGMTQGIGRKSAVCRIEPLIFTREELADLKKTDLDLFRDIVNFDFPVKGTGLYYELLYLKTGI